ncbi:unnamed protein product [Echinostoma caproni]|uniref:Aquaporin n=1 Tax=Echinostoma caproni TaxID=27848 RepID=A0A183A5P9_9TREM|nr:unnamed protein product [Echinostoma caproni]
MSVGSVNLDVDQLSPNETPQCKLNHFTTLGRIFVAEVVGIAVLCFTATIYPLSSTPAVAPSIVVSLTFVWILWVFGPISGAQINPSVTVMLFFTRRLSIIHTITYLAAQFLGAPLGSWIAMLLIPDSLKTGVTFGMTKRALGLTTGQAIGLEMIATAMLTMAVMSLCDEFRDDQWTHSHVTLFPLNFAAIMGLFATVMVSCFCHDYIKLVC